MDRPSDSLPTSTSCIEALSHVRLQSAIVQALLDELMLRPAAPAFEAALVEQLFDEVERLQDAARSARAALTAPVAAAGAFGSGSWELARLDYAPRRVA